MSGGEADGVARRAVVRGRVQGVGFREATLRRARRLGVRGWVRNEGDGTVRVHAEGDPGAVEEMLAFLREGPPLARVEAVEAEPATVEGHEQFAVRGLSAGRFVVREHAARATIDELVVADEPRAWAALGFELQGDSLALGGVRVRCAGQAGAVRGLSGWSLRGARSTDLDGLPTERSERPPPARAGAHPNGVAGLDHVVAISPDLERTVAACRAAGLDLRRVREEPTPAGAPRQAFFRLGEAILEVVQEPEAVVAKEGADRPAFFWGLALLAPELEATAARLGERVGEIRAAVQPGRRIATLRRSAGLTLPIALITPR